MSSAHVRPQLRILSWTSILLPHVIRDLLDFQDGSVLGALGLTLLGALEVTWVMYLLLMPYKWRLNAFGDKTSKYDTFAGLIYQGEYKYYGITSASFFALSWVLCYIRLPAANTGLKVENPVSFDALGVGVDILDWTRHWVAVARSLVPLILLVFAILGSFFNWFSFDAILLGLGPNVWLFCIILASLLHLPIANARWFWRRDQKTPILRDLTRRPGRTNPALNQSAEYVMRTPDDTQRLSYHNEMRQRVSRSELSAPRQAVWHHTTGLIDAANPISGKRLESFASGRVLSWWNSTQVSSEISGVCDDDLEISTVGQRLFSRCYCCLDPLAATLHKTTRQLSRQEAWRSQREVVASRPYYRPFRSTRTLRPDLTEYPSVPLSRLCTSCEDVCGQSELLRFMEDFSWSYAMDYARYALRSEPLVDEILEHCLSFPDLQESAQNGCHLCSLMIDSLSLEQRHYLLARDVEAVRRLGELENDPDTDNLHFRRLNLLNDRRVFVKILLPRYMPGSTSKRDFISSLSLIPHFGHGRVPRRWLRQREVDRARSLRNEPAQQWELEHVAPIEIRSMTGDRDDEGPLCLGIQGSTVSRSSINFIQLWLQRHAHQDDQPHRSNAHVSHGPSRLIDVQLFDDQGVPNDFNLDGMDEVFPSVRIRRFNEAHATPQYAALSYCWRPNETNVLKAGSSLNSEIYVRDLAPTIRDAIAITRRLKIPYLWVDALCILQDSVQDKNRELPRMADIYSNAALVLAAAAANDSSESIICEQNPLAMTPCLVGAFRSSWSGGVYAMPSRRYTVDALDDIRNARFRSRAWVFQEERLAQRLAYFTNNQVILHCNTCSRTARQVDWEENVDWGRMPLPDFVWPGLHSLCFPKHYDKRCLENLDITLFSKLKASSHELQTSVWFGLVEQYSKCFLSQPSDRLPAIHGLASRLQTEGWTGSEVSPLYHMGLFDSEESSVASLLWYVSDNQAKRPAQRAPSWTWASVDGAIKNNSTMCNFSPTESGVVVGSFGDHNGRLRVEGKIRIGLLKPMPEGSPRFYIGHHEKIGVDDPLYHDQFVPISDDINAGPEVQALCELEGTAVGYFVPDTDETLPDRIRGQLSRHSETPIREIYCLQIIVKPMTTAGESDFSQPWATRGLALVRCDSDDLIYRRVGYIELEREHERMEYSQFRPDHGKNRTIRSVPDIDKHGFFRNARTNVVTIV